jgi:hypothetical protein
MGWDKATTVQIILLRNCCARTLALSHCLCLSRAPSFCAGLVLA